MSNSTSTLAATDTSVTSAAIGATSKAMKLIEAKTYELSTSVTSVIPIPVNGSFSVSFSNNSSVAELPLVLLANGSTQLGSNHGKWIASTSGPNIYLYNTGDSNSPKIEISFSDNASEIIIVGTVPTDPEDEK